MACEPRRDIPQSLKSKCSARMVPTLSSLTFKVLKSTIPLEVKQHSKQAYRLGKKFVKTDRRRIFLDTCVQEGVIPKFLQFKVPENVTHQKHLFRKSQCKELYRLKHLAVKDTESARKSFADYLSTIPVHQRTCIQSIVDFELAKVRKAIARVQHKKIEWLKVKSVPLKVKSAANYRKNTSVINLSSQSLTDSELEILKMGLSMCWPRPKLFLPLEKSEAESVAYQLKKRGILNDDLVYQMQSAFKCYFKKSNVSKSTANSLKVLKKLSSNKSLYISRFDKGNGIVVDDKAKYLEKMNDFLSDHSKFVNYVPCRRSSKDPFILEEDRFNRKINTLNAKFHLPEFILKQIKAKGSQPARLYGLPKVHKNAVDPPYRPILSMKNSYLSNLSVWLDNLLKPLLPKRFNIKDTFDFVDSVKQLNRISGVMCSFDVTNLFTNIPCTRTINHIISTIDSTNLPVDKSCLRELLNLACKDILFSFNGDLYRQVDGMPMGSNLGPTMAAFAMDMLESQFDSFKGTKPIFYRRYADDCFLVFHSESEINHFFDFVNGLDSNIKFTKELEINNSISFLDTKITKLNDGEIRISWHVKDTNTGLYIPNSAYAPKRYKFSAIRSLLYRAKRICSDDNAYNEALSRITSMFVSNGYDVELIKTINRSVKIMKEKKQDASVNFVAWSLPYIAENYSAFCDKIKKINKAIIDHDVQIRPVFKISRTRDFFSNKDKVSQNLKSHCVYRFKCGHCEKVYYGETSRHLETRMDEHLKGQPSPSEVSLHVHEARKSDFSVIATTRNHKVLESILIKSSSESVLNARETSVPLILNL